MSELKPCPHCGSTYTQTRYMGLPCDRGFEQGWRGECCNCGALTRAFATESEAIDAWNTRHVETCHYIPDVMHSYYDEDDNEIDTDEADPDGCHCSCNHCGYTMMTGELGWFDEHKGEHGGIVYVPRFKHCPECGRKVER